MEVDGGPALRTSPVRPLPAAFVSRRRVRQGRRLHKGIECTEEPKYGGVCKADALLRQRAVMESLPAAVLAIFCTRLSEPTSGSVVYG